MANTENTASTAPAAPAAAPAPSAPTPAPAPDPLHDAAKFAASLAAAAAADGITLEKAPTAADVTIRGTEVVETLSPVATEPPAEAAPTEPVPAAETAPEAEAEKPAQDEKQLRMAERAEKLRSKAREYSAANAARQELRATQNRLAQIEAQRQADLQRAQRAEQLEAELRDPQARMARLRELGVSPKEIADQIIKENTPEAIIDRAKREAEVAAKKILDDAKAEQQRQSQQTQRMQETYQFLSVVRGATAESDPATPAYPALIHLYTPQQLAVEFEIARQNADARGYQYTYEDVANYLEEREKPRYNKLREDLTPKVSSSPQAPAGTAKPAVATSAQATRAPAITNAVASPAALPANYHQLTPAEQERHDIALYNRLSQPKR